MQKAESIITENASILILDDNFEDMKELDYLLSLNGYKVDGFTDLLQALEIMKIQQYDIFILDYFLESTDAEKVIERVRKLDERNNDIHIILYTAFPDKCPPLDCFKRMDIQGYIKKGVEKEDILIEIEKAKKAIWAIRKYRESKENISLGKRIKTLRKANGITQEELAKELGLVRTAIVAYEKNINEPSISNLKKMASIFKVSVDYLIDFC